MSEFQYYEFHAIDKPLNSKELETVRGMSSRVKLTSRKAVFTYSYSDFRYDEEEVLLDYFDFLIYITNWGTKRIMIKFPGQIVDYNKLKRYKISVENDYIQEIRVQKKLGYVLLDINFNEENYYEWIEEDYGYDFLDIRREILNGDYRALFLIWLRFLEDLFKSDEFELEYSFKQSLIPPNLNYLNSTSNSVKEFYGVNQDWFDAIKSYSQVKESINFEERLEQLSKEQKLFFLKKILNEEPNIKTQLINELKGKQKSKTSDRFRPTIELLKIADKAKQIESNRLSKENREKQKAHAETMAKIMDNEKAVKNEILNHINIGGTSKTYDLALSKLLELQAMYKHYKNEQKFTEFMSLVKRVSSRKSAMKRRLQEKNLIN